MTSLMLDWKQKATLPSLLAAFALAGPARAQETGESEGDSEEMEAEPKDEPDASEKDTPSEKNTPSEKDTPSEKNTPSEKDTPSEKNTPSDSERLSFLEEEIAKLRESHEALEEEVDFGGQAKDLEVERFQISGFFDTSFSKYILEDNSAVEGLVSEDMFFNIQNLNLYFASRMTDSLSMLAEIKFTFLPQGDVRSLEFPGLTDYERVDTTVRDPIDGTGKETLGGVIIERAHLTWQPTDWFGLHVGRYLTPYGIWNVDHGSPVLIGIRAPYLQVVKFVPLEQLGLQAFGRVTPVAGHHIEYAVTLSNGRGPAEQVIDYDQHKAIGGRLRYLYEGREAQFSVGGYGYWGTYTDRKQVITDLEPFTVEFQRTEAYEEFTAMADILLEVWGLRLQGEFGRRYVRYTERPLDNEFVLGRYVPNYAGWGFFALAGYTLPIQEYIGGVAIMPYFSWERVLVNDSEPPLLGQNHVFGLNIRPIPILALKIEALHNTYPNTSEGGLWALGAQMAVAF